VEKSLRIDNLNPWDVSGPSSFAASGSTARAEFLLDGVPNMAISNVSFSPSPDAVGEMRVQTMRMTRSTPLGLPLRERCHQGRHKPDPRHAYEYVQNDAFNAKSFFDNLNNRPKSIRRQNTFGGGIGGPIYLPKLYDGRNRTFFFVNYEGTRRPSLSTSSIAVPTELERKGDFSKTVDGADSAITLYDPANLTNGVRSAFPRNVIPQNRWDTLGAKILNLLPLPNVVPAPGTLQNYLDSRYRTFTWSSFPTRVDENITARQQLFFRAGWNHRVDGGTTYFPDNNVFANGADIFERGNIAGRAGWTWARSARTVIDARDAHFLSGRNRNPVDTGFQGVNANRSTVSVKFPTPRSPVRI